MRTFKNLQDGVQKYWFHGDPYQFLPEFEAWKAAGEPDHPSYTTFHWLSQGELWTRDDLFSGEFYRYHHGSVVHKGTRP